MNEPPKRTTVVRCPIDEQHQTPEHHAACVAHVRRRHEIAGPITIVFPGECGNLDAGPEWDEVRSCTVPVCDCGRDRVALPPISVRPEGLAQPLPSTLESIDLGEETFVCIRSVGDPDHAHFAVALEEGQLIVERDPITDIGEILDHRTEDQGESPMQTSPLTDLAQALGDGSSILPFYLKSSPEAPRLVFAVTAVDVANRTVTIMLGDEMETFIPDDLPSPDDGDLPITVFG